RTLGYFGLGADAVPAADARDLGYPGLAGLQLPRGNEAWSEPYIYHFPDGNASIARLLVRSLIPGAARGKTTHDVVRAEFDYGKLDRAGQRVRIRLNATCVDVRNVKGGVDVEFSVRGGKLLGAAVHDAQDRVQVAYMQADKLHRVEA